MTGVAVWGAGVAGSVYATASRLLGWTVDSIGSRTADRATSLATNVGARSAFTFASPLTAVSDLAIIATPPTHHAAAFETITSSAGTVVVAPLASTLAEADRMVAADGPHRGVLGWPLITAPTTQELMRRAGSIGAPTNLSMSSSRPLPQWGEYLTGAWGGGATQFVAHDHIALTLLLARFIGLGEPTTVTATMELNAHGVDIGAAISLTFPDGQIATIHAGWNDEPIPRSDIQLAGTDGVLRIDASPVPVLEHNGETVHTTGRSLPDEQFRPLHEAGLIDLLKTIEAELSSNRPLPHAFTFDFGRQVGDVVAAAYRSAGTDGTPVPLPFEGARNMSPLEIYRAAAT